MVGEQRHLHAAGDEDPFWRLWRELPEPWKGPVIGDGIDDWDQKGEHAWRMSPAIEPHPTDLRTADAIDPAKVIDITANLDATGTLR